MKEDQGTPTQKIIAINIWEEISNK